ncbi:hypothetical protein AB0M46_38410 [Dactylosporangium sp. NPDC051485]|uniref:hypothetical protein n=1 Tax=Dactylosporangium sp. NPDC051485 TaxID=3154846 RepID=UPI003429D2BE
MFAAADDVLDPCRPVGHEATVFPILADGPRNGPGDPPLPREAAGDLSAPHRFGAKPRRSLRPAGALRKRAARGDLPSVNRLIDAHNAVRIRFAVPIGSEDRPS